MTTSVMIGVPTTGTWKARFGVCLTMLAANLTKNKIQFAVNSKESSLLPRVRQDLVNDANKMEFDYLLFLDDDMLFPPTLFEDLAKRKKEIVAANCVVRSIERPRFTASHKGCFLNSKLMTGVTKCDKVGSAIMLLDMKAFRKDYGGLFEVPWDEEKKVYHGEDYTFCKKVKDRGLKIWIDHDLSKKVGHMGNCVFDMNYADAYIKANEMK